MESQTFRLNGAVEGEDYSIVECAVDGHVTIHIGYPVSLQTLYPILNDGFTKRKRVELKPFSRI